MSRVVIVRGSRSLTGGGAGCCSGDVRPFDEGGGHAHRPVADQVADQVADEVVEVYRALRATLPSEVALEVVAPSNWLWLVPMLLKDGRRRGLRGRALRRSVRAGLKTSTLVVDGRVLFSGALPEPAVAVAAAQAELALSAAGAG